MTNRNWRIRGVGFTLIEVLLTLVLAAALLAGLWTLLSMHLRLFDTGQTKTEQSQLARTLLAQMSDDLHSIVQMPPPPPPAPPQSALIVPGLPPSAPVSGPSSPGTTGSTPPSPMGTAQGTPPSTTSLTPGSSTGSSPVGAGNSPPSNSTSSNVAGASAAAGNATQPAMPNMKPPGATAVAVTSSLRPSGLFGTENYLQMDVLQATIVRPEAELGERLPLAAKRRSRAAELRTVIYSFEEGHDPQHPATEPRMFLARRELDWEQAHAAPRAASRQSPSPFSPAGTADVGAVSEPISPDVRSQVAHDETSAVVPEVVQFGMRYFDGSQWFKDWDSTARKALPVAIEVAVQLRAFDEPEQAVHHPVNDLTNEEARPPQLPIYRLVIHLPSAVEPVAGNGPSQMVNVGGRGGAERPLGVGTNGARR